MPIRVPILQERVQVQPANVQTPQLKPPGPGVSGADVARADAGVSRETGRFSQALAQRIAERESMRDQQRVLADDIDFRVRMQDVLLNQEAGPDGIPKGIINRKLGQADGATVEFDNAYKGLREEFLRNSGNDRQKAALAQRMDSHYAASRSGVLRHEAKEGRENFARSLSANVEKRIEDAALITDPESLSSAITQAQAIQAEGLFTMGLSEDQVEKATGDTAANMAKVSISAMADRDPRLADRTLKAIEKQIPANVAADIRKGVDVRLFADEASELWASLTDSEALLRKDGTWDLREMRKHVMALKEPQKKKEQLFDYVKGRANEDHAILRQEQQAVANANDDRERDLYIRALGGELRQSEADSLLSKGQIDIPFYDKITSRIRKRNDDPDIPPAEKAKRFLELYDGFKELRGGKVHKKIFGKLVKPASKNDLQTLQKFRDRVAESAGHLTENQERMFLDFTQRNFDSAQETKVGILNAFKERLDPLGLAEDVISDAMTTVMLRIMNPDVSVESATKFAKEEGNNLIASKNTDASKYSVGDPITLNDGRTFKVTGFNPLGKAIVELIE